MIKVTKLSQDGTAIPMVITLRNLIEISPKCDGESWVKYWDGTPPEFNQPCKPRTIVISQSVDEVYSEYYKD
jgi:hypothetical protein